MLLGFFVEDLSLLKGLKFADDFRTTGPRVSIIKTFKTNYPFFIDNDGTKSSIKKIIF